MIAPIRRATPWDAAARPGLTSSGDDSSASIGGLARSVTMLELSDLREIDRLGEEVDAAAREADLASAEPTGKRQEGPVDDSNRSSDGGFFIDSSDHSDERLGGGFLSASPDLVCDVPPAGPSPQNEEATNAGGGGGMRRVLSMASLPSQKHGLSSILFQGVPGTITEEGHEESPKARRGQRERKPSLVRSSASSQCSDFQPESLAALNDAKGERRPSQAKSGMPLRSALKGSRNNLQSSHHSVASSLDETNHSLGDSERTAGIDGSMKRNVSFASLEIRNYNVTLGDAPTPNGAPVSLDWTYDPSATESYNVDYYEQFRTDEAPRRARHEMHMSPMQRQFLLMREAGCTRGQIRQAAEECRRAALRREKTNRNTRLGLMPVEEAWEKTRRKIGKMGGSKGKR
ncbi:hypothetical protein ACHAXT_009639 [Thalassiosira profunda]